MPPKKTGTRLAQKQAKLEKMREAMKGEKKQRQPVKCSSCHKSKKHSHRIINEQGKEVHKCGEKDKCTSFEICKYVKGHEDEILQREIADLEKKMEKERQEKEQKVT